MSVTVRGRVPSQWNDQTVAHLTERLRALETAAAGGARGFTSPAAPPFGPGAGTVVVVSPGGGGPSGGVTDHGALSGLGDDDHSQYAQHGEDARALPHSHMTEDVSGLDQLRAQRQIPHVHRVEDLQCLDPGSRMPRPHGHVVTDLADFHGCGRRWSWLMGD